MARREDKTDPKETALAATRCLNPHPGQVHDQGFLASEFFDARDLVQVKYEMVRRVKADGAAVTEAAAAFGYSRPSYYQAAAALEASGLEGLVPARPGPRGASKLTEEVLAWAEEQLAADPALRPAQLPDRIEEAFGVRVHPRSAERALARRRERHSKSRHASDSLRSSAAELTGWLLPGGLGDLPSSDASRLTAEAFACGGC